MWTAIVSVISRVANLGRRRQRVNEAQEELEAHVEMLAGGLVDQGMTRDEALLAARRQVGNRTTAREDVYQENGFRTLDALAQDLRYAVRQIRRAPLLATTIVLVLALGIGGNSALFAFLQHYVDRMPAGVPASESLVRVRRTSQTADAFHYDEAMAFARASRTLTGVTSFTNLGVDVETGHGTGVAGLTAGFVVGPYFATLGLTPTGGAGLPVDVTGHEPPRMVAVLSHRAWTNQFRGDSTIVGKTANVNGLSVTITGILPPGFEQAELWMPASSFASVARAGGFSKGLDSAEGGFAVYARLVAGASAADATREADAAMQSVRNAKVSERVRVGLPPEVVTVPTWWHAEVVPLRAYNPDRSAERGVLKMAASIGALTLLVLLITCTNVSALLVGSALSRRREIAVRLSLGGTRRRILRQFVTESALLALTGGSLGVAILFVVVKVARASFPTIVDVSPSWESTAFTLVAALATSLVFGVAPAAHAMRESIGDLFRRSGTAPSRSRLQWAFVVVQVALTQPILVGVAALVGAAAFQSTRLRADNNGERILSVVLDYRAVELDAQSKARTRAFREHLADLPGVLGVTQMGASSGQIELVAVSGGITPSRFRAAIGTMSFEYLSALGVRPIAGRSFAKDEMVEGAWVAIVTAGFARKAWGSATPIGQTIAVSSERGVSRGTLTVVGIVDELQIPGDPNSGFVMEVFRPGSRLPESRFFMRTEGPAAAFKSVVEARTRQELPLTPVRRMETVAEQDAALRRQLLRVTSASAAAGALALLLAALGLYAAIAFAVGQRTREIGIRVAIGAHKNQVVWPFVARGLRLGAVGMAIGLPLSLLAYRWAGGKLIVHIPSLPTVGVVVAALVLGVTAFATWLPARRASRVDPVLALRAD